MPFEAFIELIESYLIRKNIVDVVKETRAAMDSVTGTVAGLSVSVWGSELHQRSLKILTLSGKDGSKKIIIKSKRLI